MELSQPGMCKNDGPISICHCQGPKIKEEQANCSTYKKGKRGFCTYYLSSIGWCSNFDGYLSSKENDK